LIVNLVQLAEHALPKLVDWVWVLVVFPKTCKMATCDLSDFVLGINGWMQSGCVERHVHLVFFTLAD